MVNDPSEIERCYSCGTALTAVNLSDIEPGACQGCEQIMIEKIQPIKEDPEVKNWSDLYLESVASGEIPCHQDWDEILISQGIEPHPIINRLPAYAARILFAIGNN